MEHVECMSGVVDPAFDVFICPSIFVDNCLLGVDIEARLLRFFGKVEQLLLHLVVSV